MGDDAASSAGPTVKSEFRIRNKLQLGAAHVGVLRLTDTKRLDSVAQGSLSIANNPERCHVDNAYDKGVPLTASVRPSRRSVTSLLAGMAATMVLMIAAAPASAADGPICPPTYGQTIGLQAYGSANNTDRCAHGYHNGVKWIHAINTYVDVMKCAVLKPNSNGSGGNVGGLAAACAPRTYTAIQSADGLSGYSTIINQGANYHTHFQGYLYLY